LPAGVIEADLEVLLVAGAEQRLRRDDLHLGGLVLLADRRHFPLLGTGSAPFSFFASSKQ
jgi:hypothetical protein